MFFLFPDAEVDQCHEANEDDHVSRIIEVYNRWMNKGSRSFQESLPDFRKVNLIAFFF